MKVIITVKNEKTGSAWTEEYESENLINPDQVSSRRRRTDRVFVTSQEEAQDWAEALIKGFNDSLMPNESPRTLVSVQYKARGDYGG